MANLGNPQETIAVLQRYGFNFQKKYGQILCWKSVRESER